MSPRRPLIALAALILLGFWVATARAHLGSTKYLRVEQDPTASPAHAQGGRDVQVVASLETVDVAMQLGLNEGASAQEVLARAPRGPTRRLKSSATSAPSFASGCTTSVPRARSTSQRTRRPG